MPTDWTDRYAYRFDGLHRLQADFALGPNGRGVSVGGDLAEDGGGVTVSGAAPMKITDDLWIGPRAELGAALSRVASPGGELWTLGGDARLGLDARWNIGHGHRVYGTAMLAAHGHLPYDTGAAGTFAKGARRRFDAYARDMHRIGDSVSAAVKDRAKAIIAEHMHAFSEKIGDVFLDMASAGLTSKDSDDLAAQARLDALIEQTQAAIVDDLKRELGEEGDVLARRLGARTERFGDDMRTYADSQAQRFMPGWSAGADVRLGYRGEFPLWERAGLYAGPGLDVAANVPLKNEHDRAVLSGAIDPSRLRLSATPLAGLRWNIPGTAIALTGDAGVEAALAFADRVELRLSPRVDFMVTSTFQ
ncbi:MAG: hypothetical protein IT381_04940 [Deltaproteobacteria bacterium]|nr:hypothetical protein [Deltaproteobacteria bacterium]